MTEQELIKAIEKAATLLADNKQLDRDLMRCNDAGQLPMVVKGQGDYTERWYPNDFN